MDTRTGEIITRAEARLRNARFGPDIAIPIDVPISAKQQRLKKIGRNERCPCGSGKKFKHCHLRG